MLRSEFAMVQMLMYVIRGHLKRVRQHDSGASAIELALIAAALFGVAGVVALAVQRLIDRKSAIIDLL